MKKEKKTFVKAGQGHIKHVCKNSGSISQKRRGHWTLKEFGVLCLNEPVCTFGLPFAGCVFNTFESNRFFFRMELISIRFGGKIVLRSPVGGCGF